ncbi:putative T7SS-secreted protein [Aeromicrobium fastidiosum]|uniref:Putative T7SS secretion signal domain-containing protein n=1 Tax=Aeromicrobium fastidiosum TaxID=52699 RepID=A0A641AH49_9ACTN|nr:hypothetical protein [Aeromicrobium fastidiosum]KAA1372230.1 hypothetical protein ESP62_019270 [Aeromicrobium fastidiosum]MBP2391369.1 hypothetical protein [Aeromicrobium fastidiosum]
MNAVRDYPHLGFDPVGSDERTSDEISRDLRATVNRLAEVDDVLRGSGQQDWQGRTADAFRASVDEELRPRVHDAHLSFATASRAFDGFAAQLPGWRRQADALEVEAEAATKRVEAATTKLDGLTKPEDDADSAAKSSYDDDLAAAKTSMSSSRAELADILRRANALRTDVEEVARGVARAFSTAMDLAPDEPGLWGKAKDLASDVGDRLSEAFDWFMENVAPVLQKLAKIVGAVATILSIVCFVVGFVFPPAAALGATLATVAKVASLVDIGIQALRVVHGEPGALQGLVLQGASMAAGFGLARAIGPVAMEAPQILRNGLLMPQMAGVSGSMGSMVATQAIKINPDFFSSLTYWGLTSFKDLSGSFDTIREETR